MKTISKRTKTFVLIAAATALGLTFVTSSALAGPGPGGSPEACGAEGGEFGKRAKRGHGFERMAQKLGLDEAQTTQLKDLKTAQRATFKPLRQQVRAKHDELKALWMTPNPSKAAILAKMAEIQSIKAQLAEARVDFKLSVLPILTPEQRTKFLEKAGNMGRRGHHMRGNRGKRDKRGQRGGDFQPNTL